MRITGGVLAGRRVAVPAGEIRPAMDRMRESVFASLGDLSGFSFLDVFSGSGVIALEAASRGAAPVEAVEKDPVKRKTLLKNVSMSPVRIRCRFMAAELYVSRAKAPFDVIFCDPPFPYKFKWDLLKSITASPLVHSGSRILLHRPKEDEYTKIADLSLELSKAFGRSLVDFFIFLEKK
ncbi:MAG: RsmD family RNA methyltransferase [Spirochaetaceae bacterium]|jgi:16S rRNA (guanine(966)-N(2))-methyltransferase RsmD|nr:RsmD family RNA methyltransferase [Spirochaetaceae bacterium]